MKLTLFAVMVLLGVAITYADPLSEFIDGNHKFSAKLYQEITKETPSNFIFSPFSVQVILSLLRAGAKGQTAEEFSTALNLPSVLKTEEALKEVLPRLKESTNSFVQLTSADKVYVNKNINILDSFKKEAKLYDADIENVDYSDADTSNIINRWVEQQTNNKIKDVISSSDLSPDTAAILVNALYFKGEWETPFQSETTKQNFYISKNQSVSVDMMSLEEGLKYYESEELKAKFVELPYRANNLSMIIVLPNEIEGLSALEDDLDKVLALQPLDYARVALRMPKFLIETKFELTPMLNNLGLKTVFGENADLSGISQNPVSVSQVIQKAFINVTESGTEAAAATAVIEAESLPLPPDYSIVADRPFLFYIQDSDVILLIGKISNP